MDIIIGAGITGLSYANFTRNEFLILEAEEEAGGYCRTIKKDGFVWDYSGHFFHFKNLDIKKYMFEGMAKQKIYDVKKKSQIYYDGCYVDFPFQKNIHQLPKKDFIDCLYELYFRSGEDRDSFKGMLLEKFGRGISEKFLIPYNEKLYACDLDELDSEAMGRFFPHADIEEIIRNFKGNENGSYNSSFMYPEGGAIEYVNSLLNRIDQSKIRYSTRAQKIDINKKIVKTSLGEEIKYDRLINTMPFNKFMNIVGYQNDDGIYSCNKVAVFNLGFDLPSKTNNHWIYYPSKELVFYRVGFYDNIYSSNHMSLYVEIGYPDSADIESENFLLDSVIRDLKKVGVVQDHKLISYHYLEMNPAYVHINKKANLDFEKKMKELNLLGVYSAGRYGAWKYCSIEDNIIEAKTLVERMSKEV